MKPEAVTYLKTRLTQFAGLTEADIVTGIPFWRTGEVLKGNFYNKRNVVCKDLGILVKGIFRLYHFDPETEEEKNIFFFSEGQFIVSFASFVYQYPCSYYIEALEDSEIIYISYQDLQNLYANYRPWERFGRILAEHFFTLSQMRASYHLASYLGIKNQSLSRIKKRLQG